MSRGCVPMIRPRISPLVGGILLGVAMVGCRPASIQSTSPSPTPATSPPSTRATLPSGLPVTAFVDVAVIPMDKERVLPKQTVLVQEGRIVALGPAAQVQVPAGATRVEGEGKYLIPGLSDMHIHLGANHGDSASAERALFLLLANGVTTARNMDYRPKGMGQMGLEGRFLQKLRAQTASGELMGPRLYTSGPWGPPAYINVSRPARLDSVVIFVAAYKAAGYDFVKIHDEDKVVAESVVVAAHRVGIPVLGHPRLPDMTKVLEGYTSIEHLMGYAGRGTQAGGMDLDSLVALTRSAGVWQVPTLNVIVDQSVSPTIKAVIAKMQAAGVGMLSGTDACASTTFGIPGPSLHRELGLLVEAGLTPYQALVTSTRNVAAYLGHLDERGTIAQGKRADLVLLNGDPLTDIANTKQIAGVMIDGRWFSEETLAPRLAKEMAALGKRP